MSTTNHNINSTSTETVGPSIQPYKYEPLLRPSSIRILILDPAEAMSVPLRGSIIQVDRHEERLRLEGGKQYSAVSYRWDNDFNERLIIKSSESEGVFYLSISQTIKVMLLHLRKRHKHKYLWIDALCLNQKDKMEKAVQVGLMGDIYLQAHKVHIWLGLQDSNTTKVFAYLRSLSLAPEDTDATQIFGSNNQFDSAMDSFFLRPWFSRRWTLQEAYRARNAVMHLGHYSIPYSVFLAACRSMHTADQVRKRYGCEMTLTLSEKDTDIFVLLWKLHRSECSEEADRFRALFGLIPAKSRQLHKHNYLDLCISYAGMLVNSPRQHELICHLLQFGRLACAGGSDSPSWIPAWSSKRSKPAVECLLPLPDSHKHLRDLQIPKALLDYQAWATGGGQEQIEPSMDSSPRKLDAWMQWLFHEGKHPSVSYDERWQSFHAKDFGELRNAPYTIFSIQKRSSGFTALNVKWVNPWAGLFGQRVAKAIGPIESPNNIENMMQALEPLKSYIANDLEALHNNLDRFTGIVEAA